MSENKSLSVPTELEAQANNAMEPAHANTTHDNTIVEPLKQRHPHSDITYHVYGHKSEGKIALHMVQENGKWVVDSLKAVP